MEIKIFEAELEILKLLLSQITIKNRTGEIGIMHGTERFVSTKIVLKKDGVQLLQQLAKKAGTQIKNYVGLDLP